MNHTPDPPSGDSPTWRERMEAKQADARAKQARLREQQADARQQRARVAEQHHDEVRDKRDQARQARDEHGATITRLTDELHDIAASTPTLSDAADEALLGSFCGIRVENGEVLHARHRYTLAGARAEITEQDTGKRVTATRAATLGVVALAARKRTRRVRATVTGRDYQFSEQVPQSLTEKAYRWADVFNTAAMQAETQGDA